jgi:hypothetical protein
MVKNELEGYSWWPSFMNLYSFCFLTFVTLYCVFHTYELSIIYISFSSICSTHRILWFVLALFFPVRWSKIAKLILKYLYSYWFQSVQWQVSFHLLCFKVILVYSFGYFPQVWALESHASFCLVHCFSFYSTNENMLFRLDTSNLVTLFPIPP